MASSSSPAAAQASPLPDSFVVGAWTFRPSLDVRIRGEYRRHPFDAGGEVYDPTAVLAEDYESTLPKVASTQPAVANQYFVTERARLGLAVDRGPITAAVTLQDARVWGDTGATGLVAPGRAGAAGVRAVRGLPRGAHALGAARLPPRRPAGGDVGRRAARRRQRLVDHRTLARRRSLRLPGRRLRRGDARRHAGDAGPLHAGDLDGWNEPRPP